MGGLGGKDSGVKAVPPSWDNALSDVMGIVGVKERVYPFNGDIKFVSNQGQGAKVIITFPVNYISKN